MSFNSVLYVTFLMFALAVFWVLPRRWRMPFLVLASCYFYASWVRRYLVLILAMTAVTYLVGLLIARSTHRRGRLLAVGLVANLGTLAVYKYANFGLDSVTAAVSVVGASLRFPAVGIDLPLGISFFTFEFIHYLVDVWRGDQPVRSPLRFAIFGLFFPTQISGPIKRYQSFVPQIAEHRFDSELFEHGVTLVIRGFFKKLVLADSLAPIADLGFGATSSLSAADAWIATYAFALQIFFDFSGYTDIGRGSAALLGFRVPENFLAPYAAVGFRDFWRRWHVSLSSWLRDYVYIPLGGSRRGRGRTYVNLLATMILGGLWHGAAWHFAVWGAVHGALLAAQRRFADTLPRAAPGVAAVARPLAVFLTFHLVCVGWTFFRAPTLTDALTVAGHLVVPRGLGLAVFTASQAALVLGVLVSLWLLASRLPDAALRWLRGRSFGVVLASRTAYYTLVLVGAVALAAPDPRRFIYFQF